MIKILLFLSTALNAASAPKTQVMNGVSSIFTVSPTGRLIASNDDSGINVWKLGDARPSARIEWLPGSETDAIIALAISHDDKKILISRADYGATPEVSKTFQLAIADIETETIVAKSPSRSMHCGSRGGNGIGSCERYGPAAFAPDGSEAHYQAHYWDEPVTADFRLTLNGKIIETAMVRLKWDDKRSNWLDERGGVVQACGYAADGRRLTTRLDASNCSVVDCAAKKRVSFLERCSAAEAGSISLSFDGRRVSGAHKNEQLFWDAATGDLLKAVAREPEPAFPESNGVAVDPSGRFFAEVFSRRSSTGTAVLVKLYAADTGEVADRVEAAASEPPFLRENALLPGASAILLYVGSSVQVVSLGGARATAPRLAAAPAAAGKVNVDRVPATAAAADPDAYAVVIGIEKYRQAGIPSVDYAARDAMAVRDYLVGAMGYDAKNTVLLTDAQAARTDFDKHLGKWLRNRVGAKSRVFIYYAGHGAPNPSTGEGYLMPFEADPAYLEETAFPLARLYAELAKLPAKDVTVVLDACFSGQGQRSLIAKGSRPLVATVPIKSPGSARIIAAASSSQISLSDPETRHGLLTYYLLEGLHGGADADKDGAITGGELFAYAQPAVERAARLQNAEQTPTSSGGGASERPWIVLKKD